MTSMATPVPSEDEQETGLPAGKGDLRIFCQPDMIHHEAMKNRRTVITKMWKQSAGDVTRFKQRLNRIKDLSTFVVCIWRSAKTKEGREVLWSADAQAPTQTVRSGSEEEEEEEEEDEEEEEEEEERAEEAKEGGKYEDEDKDVEEKLYDSDGDDDGSNRTPANELDMKELVGGDDGTKKRKRQSGVPSVEYDSPLVISDDDIDEPEVACLQPATEVKTYMPQHNTTTAAITTAKKLPHPGSYYLKLFSLIVDPRHEAALQTLRMEVTHLLERLQADHLDMDLLEQMMSRRSRLLTVPLVTAASELLRAFHEVDTAPASSVGPQDESLRQWSHEKLCCEKHFCETQLQLTMSSNLLQKHAEEFRVRLELVQAELDRRGKAGKGITEFATEHAAQVREIMQLLEKEMDVLQAKCDFAFNTRGILEEARAMKADKEAWLQREAEQRKGHALPKQ